MPLGAAAKTTPIYSGFPRALLWGINPPNASFGAANPPPGFPGETSAPAAAETSSVCGPGHWLLRCLEQVPAFPSLPICAAISVLRPAVCWGSFCPESRAASAALCFSQTPPSFPEIPAHPSPSNYPLRSSALFPVSLFAFPLFPGFGVFWEGIPCPGLPSVVLLFFPQSLWAGTSSPSQGREGRREAEREGGSTGGGTEEARKARRQSVQGSRVRKARGRNAMGKEDRGPCAKKEFGGNIQERFFIGSFINNAAAADSNLPRKARNPPSAWDARHRGYSRQRDILQKMNIQAQGSQWEHRLQQGKCRMGIWWVRREREAKRPRKKIYRTLYKSVGSEKPGRGLTGFLRTGKKVEQLREVRTLQRS